MEKSTLGSGQKENRTERVRLFTTTTQHLHTMMDILRMIAGKIYYDIKFLIYSYLVTSCCTQRCLGFLVYKKHYLNYSNMTLTLSVNSNIAENGIPTKCQKLFWVIMAKKYFKNVNLVQNTKFTFCCF